MKEILYDLYTVYKYCGTIFEAFGMLLERAGSRFEAAPGKV